MASRHHKYYLIISKSGPNGSGCKTCTVFGSLNIGIAISNHVRGMNMCPPFCVVLSCVGKGLASGRSPYQGVLRNVQIGSYNFWTGTARWPIPWRIIINCNWVNLKSLKNIYGQKVSRYGCRQSSTILESDSEGYFRQKLLFRFSFHFWLRYIWIFIKYVFLKFG